MQISSKSTESTKKPTSTSPTSIYTSDSSIILSSVTPSIRTIVETTSSTPIAFPATIYTGQTGIFPETSNILKQVLTVTKKTTDFSNTDNNTTILVHNTKYKESEPKSDRSRTSIDKTTRKTAKQLSVYNKRIPSKHISSPSTTLPKTFTYSKASQGLIKKVHSILTSTSHFPTTKVSTLFEIITSKTKMTTENISTFQTSTSVHTTVRLSPSHILSKTIPNKVSSSLQRTSVPETQFEMNNRRENSVVASSTSITTGEKTTVGSTGVLFNSVIGSSGEEMMNDELDATIQLESLTSNSISSYARSSELIKLQTSAMTSEAALETESQRRVLSTHGPEGMDSKLAETKSETLVRATSSGGIEEATTPAIVGTTIVVVDSTLFESVLNSETTTTMESYDHETSTELKASITSGFIKNSVIETMTEAVVKILQESETVPIRF